MYYRQLSHGSQLAILSNYVRATFLVNKTSKPMVLASTCIGWRRASIRVYGSERSTGRNTIFALSSGAGKCGVMVFRVSGALVTDVMRSIAKCSVNPEPRKAHIRRFYHPVTGEQIDRGLLLWFPGPNSFTGEDCCELHVHGGLAVSSAVMDALGSMSGLRYAEPGEFTRRSFQNGKLDLTEVEGLADLIHSETEAQRRQALRQMDGALSRLYAEWRLRLVKCVAHLEAFIDFSEEENIEEGIIESVLKDVLETKTEITRHLTDNRRGERLRSGVHLAIIGEPNVGKSSLLNSLCQRPAAIVSPVAGTTRDVIETTLNVAGYPVVVCDTAGLRQTSDDLEMEGVWRAIKRSEEADLVVLVVECTDSLMRRLLYDGQLTVDQFVSNLLQRLGLVNTCLQSQLNGVVAPPLAPLVLDERLSVSRDDQQKSDPSISNFCKYFWGGSSSQELILVLNKQDLLSQEMARQLEDVLSSDQSGISWCLASCTSRDGLDEFLKILSGKLKSLCSSSSGDNSPSLTNERHRLHLTNCLKFLVAYIDRHSEDSVLGAEDLRRAMHQMGKITGRVTSDDVLDVIFRDFCIGK